LNSGVRMASTGVAFVRTSLPYRAKERSAPRRKRGSGGGGSATCTKDPSHELIKCEAGGERFKGFTLFTLLKINELMDYKPITHRLQIQ
jgi:hypothetical protein